MHTTSLRWSALVCLVAAALAAAACSNNSNKNPVDQMTAGTSRALAEGLALTAVPPQIVINPADPNTPTDPDNGGKRYGETALTAVATDTTSGAPQPDLALTFTATAGRLASNGQPVMTDAQGVAHDTLRVYEDDPGSIDVSVTDGTRTSTIAVTKVVEAPPVANAGADQTVECTGGAKASVTLDASATTDPDGNITLYEWFENYSAATPTLLGTGVTLVIDLPVGAHTITLKVTDATGASATDEVVVDVVDTAPPTINVRLSPATLWPPNHRMVDIHATVGVEECGTSTLTLVSVTSSEPDNGTGDGDTTDDIQGADVGTADSDFQLRAERSGSGPGRLYTIVYKVVDAGGLESSATAWVRVPHDRSGR